MQEVTSLNRQCGRTCNDSPELDNAHGVLKQDVEDAVQPALGGEDRSGDGDHDWQVHQRPQGNADLCITCQCYRLGNCLCTAGYSTGVRLQCVTAMKEFACISAWTMLCKSTVLVQQAYMQSQGITADIAAQSALQQALKLAQLSCAAGTVDIWKLQVQEVIMQKKPTSGVKTERGTRVQKKPSETQWVANLRMPK